MSRRPRITPDYESPLRQTDWLAGFIDGEGHLSVHLDSRHNNRWPVLEITQRDDDLVLMENIALALGGCVKRKLGHQLGLYEQKAQARVCVGSKASLMGVVEYLDVHPLRSKKAVEYVVWREAVLAYVDDGGRAEGLANAKETLHRLKEYTPPLQTA